MERQQQSNRRGETQQGQRTLVPEAGRHKRACAKQQRRAAAAAVLRPWRQHQHGSRWRRPVALVRPSSAAGSLLAQRGSARAQGCNCSLTGARQDSSRTATQQPSSSKWPRSSRQQQQSRGRHAATLFSSTKGCDAHRTHVLTALRCFSCPAPACLPLLIAPCPALQEEERERRYDFAPDVSAVDTQSIEVRVRVSVSGGAGSSWQQQQQRSTLVDCSGPASCGADRSSSSSSSSSAVAAHPPRAQQQVSHRAAYRSSPTNHHHHHDHHRPHVSTNPPPSLCPLHQTIPQVDKETFEMLKAINMAGLPGITQAAVRAAGGGGAEGLRKAWAQQSRQSSGVCVCVSAREHTLHQR
jgi:hypothetical protein